MNTGITQVQKIEKVFFNKKKLWDKINNLLHRNKLQINGFCWHEDTFIPLNLWYELFNKDLSKILKSDLAFPLATQKDVEGFIYNLMTLAAWRYSQGSYHINSYAMSCLVESGIGSRISKPHLTGLQEWSLHIPLENTYLNGIPCSGFFCHKNNSHAFNKNLEPDALIITIDMNYSIHGPFRPMPYIVLDITKDKAPMHSILTYGGIQPKDLQLILNVCLQLLNLIGDKSTSIESEFVGLKKPHHSDIDQHINFDNFNIPSFRLVAPSNSRKWIVGSNYFNEKRKLMRNSTTHQISDLHWTLINDQLALIPPKYKKAEGVD